MNSGFDNSSIDKINSIFAIRIRKVNYFKKKLIHMKKLLLLVAAVSFTAVTFAQSAQSVTATPATKSESKKECG